MNAKDKTGSTPLPAQIPFRQVMDALLNEDNPFHPRHLYRFSDLEPSELHELEKTWPRVSARRRQAIMEDVEELGDKDTILSFEAFCRYALGDEDARVRELAVRTLWEYENVDLAPLFIKMLTSDSETTVRAVTATALGKYIYLGEIEELPESMLNEIVDVLLNVYGSSEAELVRRRALESLGFSSREEVPPIIESAFYSGRHDWIVSALFAMGRTASSQWNQRVLEMLDNDDAELRIEAVRAAGELEIRQASPRLIELLNDSDNDIRMAAIWSLSQIGGEGVQDALELMLDETEDDEEAELIEEAIDNLSFNEDIELFSMFEFESDADEGEDIDKPDDDID